MDQSPNIPERIRQLMARLNQPMVQEYSEEVKQSVLESMQKLAEENGLAPKLGRFLDGAATYGARDIAKCDIPRHSDEEIAGHLASAFMSGATNLLRAVEAKYNLVVEFPAEVSAEANVASDAQD